MRLPDTPELVKPDESETLPLLPTLTVPEPRVRAPETPLPEPPVSTMIAPVEPMTPCGELLIVIRPLVPAEDPL